MKKTCLVFLLVLMCAVVSTASANEILFRGVQWGVNPSEARKQIDNPDLYMQATYESGFLAYPSGTAERLLDNSKNVWYGNYEFFYQNENLIMVASSFAGREAKVAGYKLDILRMFFANDIQNGLINDDENALHFAIAEYTFDVLDGINAYSDLKTKLSELYGDGEELTDHRNNTLWYDDGAHDYSISTYIVTFDGDNGTHAQLVCTESIAAEAPETPAYSVTLTYWSEQYEALFREKDMILAKEEYNAQLQEEMNVGRDEMDGL